MTLRRISPARACLVLWVLTAGAPARADDFAARRLQAAGVAADVEGIASYLRAFLPDPERGGRRAELLEQLGSGDFREREEAAHELATLPDPPIAALEAAARSDSAEIRRRARAILQRVDRVGHLSTLLTALEVIEAQQLKGLAEPLIELISLRQDPRVTEAASEALKATARGEDAASLREGVASEDRQVRAACIRALALVCGESCAEELKGLLRSDEEAIRLAAAEGLASLEDRACLPALVDLLESARFEIRRDSSGLLRAVTGRASQYAAHAPAADRQQHVRDWRAWLDEHGTTTALQQPSARRQTEIGRTLVCVWAEKSLLEVDVTGRTVFSAGGFDYVWGCQGLENGHRLAVDAEQRCVIEYDAAGHECWRQDNLPGRPTSVERLPDGNTLLALSDQHMVIELALSGETIWRAALHGRPTTAQRLENGNTLVNLQDGGEVVEIDREGTIVWRLRDLKSSHTAQGLENGNVLVCEMKAGRVAEYNRAGKVVWSNEGLQNPAQAQRLSNGNTLIADEHGLHEIDHSGQRVWHLEVSRARFHRY